MAGGGHQMRRLPAKTPPIRGVAVLLVVVGLALGGCSSNASGTALAGTMAGAPPATTPATDPATAGRTTTARTTTSTAATAPPTSGTPGVQFAGEPSPTSEGSATPTPAATATVAPPASPTGGAATTSPATTVPDNAAGRSSAAGPVGASGETASSGQAEPTVMPTTASATLFYIALGDAGAEGQALGCGDSAIPVTSAAITFTDPVEGALRTLLADHSPRLGESKLVNALWQSRLTVQSVDRTGPIITAHLGGTVSLAGACDIPRMEQQLMLTAGAAAGAPVAVTINGKTLSAALSPK